MEIREADKKDLSAIAEIWNYYILNSTYNYDYTPKTADFFESWFEKKKKEGLPIFVVETQNQIAGYGTYGQFRERDGYLHSAEHGLYFSKEFLGKGFGKRLLKHLIADATNRGFHTLVAGIDSSNPGSISFHKKMGFEEIGIFRQIGFKNGEWLDCVFLQKIL
jgi:L-amino acid N-acyltransferase YncA